MVYMDFYLKVNEETLVILERLQQRVAVSLSCKLNSLWPWNKAVENQTEKEALKE